MRLPQNRRGEGRREGRNHHGRALAQHAWGPELDPKPGLGVGDTHNTLDPKIYYIRSEKFHSMFPLEQQLSTCGSNNPFIGVA